MDGINLTIGGIGLLLIGMHMMTDGLRLAAGRSIKALFANMAERPLAALSTGAAATAILQSSSAVTVAVLSFVNAAVMPLRSGLWLTYGSNIGTTLTAWVVAIIGFKFDLALLAMPLIGLGALTAALLSWPRWRAFATACAGFGLFFLGISLLKQAIAVSDNWIQLAVVAWVGPLGIILMVMVGALMTAVMQSSSATIAIAVAAVGSGAIALPTGAAVVIGANIGTTSTAWLAVIGASSNAKRIALAHSLFNIITGAVALTLFPLLMPWFNQPWLDAAMFLALFHTFFNMLGTALMLPLSARMESWLLGRFVKRSENVAQPQFISDSLLPLPDMATDAAHKEVSRLATLVQEKATELVNLEDPLDKDELEQHLQPLRQLAGRISDFASKLSRQPLPATLTDSLANSLNAAQYYRQIMDLCEELNELEHRLRDKPGLGVSGELLGWMKDSLAYWQSCVSLPLDVTQQKTARKALNQRYQALKSQLLKATLHHELSLGEMDHLLREISLIKMLTRLFYRATPYLADLVRSDNNNEAEAEKEKDWLTD